MPCRTRLAIPGNPWHIIQRGNNRSACFYTKENYRRYLDTLREQGQAGFALSHPLFRVQAALLWGAR